MSTGEHVHKCNAEGCEQFVCCEDDCCEEDQETEVFCEKHMSTGENINANGLTLSAAMVRTGFRMFPQTEAAWVHPALWVQIPPLQTILDYPFIARASDVVPAGEVWFIGTTGEVLGRIVNIGSPIEKT